MESILESMQLVGRAQSAGWPIRCGKDTIAPKEENSAPVVEGSVWLRRKYVGRYSKLQSRVGDTWDQTGVNRHAEVPRRYVALGAYSRYLPGSGSGGWALGWGGVGADD